MSNSSLVAIRTKVRRLTRSLSTSQLTDAQIDEYVNTFVLYDFPEHLRLFNLRKTFTFYTEPYIDVYETSTDVTSPLYNFKNKYITVHPPIYIAGVQSVFAESRDQFFSIYPMITSIASIGTNGDGATTAFSGTINQLQVGSPSSQQAIILRNDVLFSSIDASGVGLGMIDYPISSTLGNLYVPGGDPTSTTVQDVNNYINYTTGQFVVTFTAAPASGEQIFSQTVPQAATLPASMLFFDGKFTLRPIPDKVYKVDMEVYAQPTEFLGDEDLTQEPHLSEWWQYIAYGASKKVFEDRMDLESVQMIMPEFKKQEVLILRRTIVQQTSQRTQTIYEQNTGAAGAYGPGLFSGGGQF